MQKFVKIYECLFFDFLDKNGCMDFPETLPWYTLFIRITYR